MTSAMNLVSVICLVSIRGYWSLPTVQHENPGPDPDYYDYNDQTTPATPAGPSTYKSVFRQCDYSPCREKQTPCERLSASTGCFCPGSTLHDTAPMVPDLRTVSLNGSEVVLHWCAPHSYVTSYVVTLGGEEKRKFESDRRYGALGEIDHITEVCVAAVNDAGRSDWSCMMYRPRDIKLPLTAGLIGGALGLLLLLLLAALLWRRRRQRTQGARVSTSSSAGRQ